MFLDKIRLNDFRNYSSLEVDLENGLNVFFGQNAQGKTNILEAVYFCALGKSHRGAPDSELIRWESLAARACMHVKKDGRPGSVEIRLQKGQKRVLIDGVPIERLVQLMGALMVVMFSPEDLHLIKDGPSLRRRYMDTLLCQIKPSYFHDLQVYNRAMIQRNRLLQTGKTGAIDGFDVQMSKAGMRIAAARAHLTGILEPLCAQEHAALSGGEKLGIEYKTGLDVPPEDAQGYFSALKTSLPSDLQRGVTTKGVHRDDLVIMIEKKDARRFASQGQQRTAALALRLAQCLAMEQIEKKRPVLLLDDVLSELDSNRVEHLLNTLRDRQALLTCTSPVHADLVAQPFASFLVCNGCVTRV